MLPKGDDLIDGAAERLSKSVYINSLYQVIVRRIEPTNPRGLGAQVELSIRRLDNQPVHDWRDLQRIKNEILGPEVECVELYPAESRLVDTANQYWLYAIEGLRWPFGLESGSYPKQPIPRSAASSDPGMRTKGPRTWFTSRGT
jgi:hypothetical protein